MPAKLRNNIRGDRGRTCKDDLVKKVARIRSRKDDQLAALKARLKVNAGTDVAIDAKVDPSILGGIVVRLGSQMIDASIKTKLNTLALAMKG